LPYVAAHNLCPQSPPINVVTEEQRPQVPSPPRTGQEGSARWITDRTRSRLRRRRHTHICVRNGNNWVLNGSKPQPPRHYADTFVALPSRQGQRLARHHAFILEKGMPGFRHGKKKTNSAWRAATLRVFHRLQIPAENLLVLGKVSGFTAA